MKLGIKGNENRGDEIIKILEMLGGKNRHEMKGSIYGKYFYYIDDEYKDISYSYIGPDEIKGYKIFTLEDFLEKYPYKAGYKVNIYVQSDDIEGWFDIEVAEITSMRWDPEHCRIVYKMKDINREFCVEDIKGKVDEDQQIDYVELVNKTYEEEAGKMCAEITMDTLYKTGITHEYLKERGFNLPEGHHFTDENGNVIGATKILLVKNSPYYPKNYDECCDMLDADEFIGHELMREFPKLINARNAYWKIAGEKLGLGKPWEPDWNESTPKYTIIVIENKLVKHYALTQNYILAFPTEEMRDAFYENFKDLIEKCKELL
jgi:hypothetical protein